MGSLNETACQSLPNFAGRPPLPGHPHDPRRGSSAASAADRALPTPVTYAGVVRRAESPLTNRRVACRRLDVAPHGPKKPESTPKRRLARASRGRVRPPMLERRAHTCREAPTRCQTYPAPRARARHESRRRPASIRPARTCHVLVPVTHDEKSTWTHARAHK
eukprot:4219520-Prymnesium_polylepis.1